MILINSFRILTVIAKGTQCSVMSGSLWPWTVACQAPLSMWFPRQECCSGLPFPPPGDLSDPGIESTAFLVSPALAGGFFTTAPPGKPLGTIGGLKCRSNIIILTFPFVFRVFKVLCWDNCHADFYKWLFSWEMIREEKNWIWRDEYKVSHIVNILLILSFISLGDHPIPIPNLSEMHEANDILPFLELDTQFSFLITVLIIEWIPCLYIMNKEHRSVLS